MRILTYPRDVKLLRTPGKVVTPEMIKTPEFQTIIQEMAGLLKGEEIGLAATQVGIPLRFFILRIDKNLNQIEPKVYINPKIQKVSIGEIKDVEGCLSFPGLYLKISRPREIKFSHYTLDWEFKEEIVSNFFGRAMMHETDHILGKLFIDLIDKVQTADVLQPWLKRQK